jgi:hypothetical protein
MVRWSPPTRHEDGQRDSPHLMCAPVRETTDERRLVVLAVGVVGGRGDGTRQAHVPQLEHGVVRARVQYLRAPAATAHSSTRHRRVPVNMAEQDFVPV